MAPRQIVLGFTGLDFTTDKDAATIGKLIFRVRDHPQNADIHALLLGKLCKRLIVITLDGDQLTVALKEE